MKAVLVNHRYQPFAGGSEVYIEKLGEWLASRGVSVRVVTTDAHDLEYFWDPSARRIDAARREALHGVAVERVPVRHIPFGSVAFPVARRLMGESSRVVSWRPPFSALARFMPLVPNAETEVRGGGVADVVVVTNLGLEGLALRGARAAKRLGAKLVVIPFAHLGSGDDDVARRFTSMPHQRALLNAADLVLTMTELEASYVVDKGAEPHRVVPVGAGVELREVTGGCATRALAGIDGDGLVVAAVGALAADKGTCDLIEASAILIERNCPIRLLLIGPELRSFERWIERRGADRWPWVHRLGTVDDETKRDVLAAMDVFALPSRTESFGIVFLEAWANEKPVVAAGVGAVQEIVADGEDGLLVPYGNPLAIADAIELLLNATDLRHRLAVAGRRKVESRYTWHQVLSRIERAFEDVLGLRVGGAVDES